MFWQVFASCHAHRAPWGPEHLVEVPRVRVGLALMKPVGLDIYTRRLVAKIYRDR